MPLRPRRRKSPPCPRLRGWQTRPCNRKRRHGLGRCHMPQAPRRRPPRTPHCGSTRLPRARSRSCTARCPSPGWSAPRARRPRTRRPRCRHAPLAQARPKLAGHPTFGCLFATRRPRGHNVLHGSCRPCRRNALHGSCRPCRRNALRGPGCPRRRHGGREPCRAAPYDRDRFHGLIIRHAAGVPPPDPNTGGTSLHFHRFLTSPEGRACSKVKPDLAFCRHRTVFGRPKAPAHAGIGRNVPGEGRGVPDAGCQDPASPRAPRAPEARHRRRRALQRRPARPIRAPRMPHATCRARPPRARPKASGPTSTPARGWASRRSLRGSCPTRSASSRGRSCPTAAAPR